MTDDELEPEYEERSTAQLKAELRARDLSDAGVTEELIDRLQEDDDTTDSPDDGEDAGSSRETSMDRRPGRRDAERPARRKAGRQTGGTQMPINRPHARYLNLLIERAANRRYPSHHMLQRIESAITDRATAEAYFDLVLSEQEKRRYPSHHMLERARQVMIGLALADEITRREREAEAHTN